MMKPVNQAIKNGGQGLLGSKYLGWSLPGSRNECFKDLNFRGFDARSSLESLSKVWKWSGWWFPTQGVFTNLDLTSTQDSSQKWRFRSGFPTKNGILPGMPTQWLYNAGLDDRIWLYHISSAWLEPPTKRGEWFPLFSVTFSACGLLRGWWNTMRGQCLACFFFGGGLPLRIGSQHYSPRYLPSSSKKWGSYWGATWIRLNTSNDSNIHSD